MNCQGFRRSLEKAPDLRRLLEREPLIGAHLAGCCRCQELYRFERLMRKAGKKARIRAPRDLWEEISARIAAKPQRSRPAELLLFSWFRLRPMAATAVAVLILAAVVALVPPRFRSAPWKVAERWNLAGRTTVKADPSTRPRHAIVDEGRFLLQMHERSPEFGDFYVGYLAAGWDPEPPMPASRNPGFST